MKYGLVFQQEKLEKDKIMKVLHLPINIASIPSHTVKGLRKIGIDAKGIIFGEKYCQSNDDLIVIPDSSNSLEKLWKKFIFSGLFVKLVRWADIIHWYFGTTVLPWDLDIRFVSLLRKPALIEWLGSDIRIPEIEFQDNPYYKKTFPSVCPSKQLKKSIKKQKKFAKANFSALVPPCMVQYLKKELWKDIYILRQRIMISEYTPLYPDAEKKCPVIVHTPTNPLLKGTSAVLAVISQLKKKYDFEFHLIQNLPRHEALNFIKKTDIFLDQFILGSHGMAAIEAMACGKPVVCYIKPSLITKYPQDLPIVNANLDNLVMVLEKLIVNGKKRYEIGKQSRNYVERYHDAVKLAHKLVEIYSEIIKKRKH